MGHEGYTPLHLATVLGAHEVASVLVDGGADTEVKTIGENTPLHLAVIHKQKTVGQVLLEAGADTGATNNFGLTPLELVGSLGEPIAEVLLAHNPSQLVGDDIVMDAEQLQKALDLGVPAQTFERPLNRMYGKRFNRKGGNRRSVMLQLLLDHELDPSRPDESGNTLLHKMCKRGAPSKESQLVINVAGEDVVNRRNAEGDTPLHCCMKGEYIPSPAMVKVLFEGGADASIRDTDGKSALDLVSALERKRRVSHAKLLRKHIIDNGCPPAGSGDDRQAGQTQAAVCGS